MAFRKPECISKASACINQKDTESWFSRIFKYISGQDQIGDKDYSDALKDPARCYNGDETFLMLNPSKGPVVVPKGTKNVFEIKDGSEKEGVTCMACFSADGGIVMPQVVYPYERVPAIIRTSFPSSLHMSCTMATKKVKNLNLKEKYEAIVMSERDKNNVKEISSFFQCGTSQIYNILKAKEDIKDRFLSSAESEKNVKKNRINSNEELNEAVFEWFGITRSKSFPISGPILQEQALKIGKLTKDRITLMINSVCGWKHILFFFHII